MNAFCVVLVSVPTASVARSLTQKILSQHLAACVNTIPGMRSSYWWKGKIESAKEVLLIIKTRRSLTRSLTTFVVKNHPYDVPEVVILPIQSGNAEYLKWLQSETQPH